MNIEENLGIIITNAEKEKKPQKTAEEKLNESFSKLVKISEELTEKCDKTESISNGESSEIPDENQVEPAPRNEPLKSVVSPEYVKRVIHELDTMSTEMLKQALAAIKITASGTKRQLRKKVAHYYRKENMLLNRKVETFNSDKTFRFFDYLVAIDFECTCVEVIYNYPHEIIELPAVLIDVKDMKIVSMFRTYIRPVINPILSDFCVTFTKIAQETVDKAPYFREGLHLLFDWMRSYGLGEKGVRFAFVTDGPHDMWKFMQFQCMLSGMKMPHMFRSFINIKKIFKDRYHGIAKGNGKSGIENMLAKFDLKFQGNKHSGLDDAKNIAIISLEMMKRKIELRINQKCAHKLNKTSINEDGDEDNHSGRREMDIYRRDFQLWMRKLPLKLHTVSRREFLNEEYLDCESCDEMSDEQTDQNSKDKKMSCRQELMELIEHELSTENEEEDEEKSENEENVVEKGEEGRSEIEEDSDYEEKMLKVAKIAEVTIDEEVDLKSIWRGNEEILTNNEEMLSMHLEGNDQFLTSSSSSGSTMIRNRSKYDRNEERRAPRNSLASVYRNYGHNRTDFN